MELKWIFFRWALWGWWVEIFSGRRVWDGNEIVENTKTVWFDGICGNVKMRNLLLFENTEFRAACWEWGSARWAKIRSNENYSA